MPRTGPLSLPDVYLVADIRTVLPPVPDVVKLPVVAVERKVREIAEVRQVTTVPLVFRARPQHRPGNWSRPTAAVPGWRG
jgi:hypothetical protein